MKGCMKRKGSDTTFAKYIMKPIARKAPIAVRAEYLSNIFSFPKITFCILTTTAKKKANHRPTPTIPLYPSQFLGMFFRLWTTINEEFSAEDSTF